MPGAQEEGQHHTVHLWPGPAPSLLGSGNLHLMAKAARRDTLPIWYTQYMANTHSTGAAWGSDPQQKAAGIQPWPLQPTGSICPLGEHQGQYEGHRETCGLASAITVQRIPENGLS